MAGSGGSGADGFAGRLAVRRFIEAFDREDLDAFVDVLHPEVVIHAGRGPRHGVEAARQWARRTTENLVQRVHLDEIETAGDRALARVRREWRWREGDELADRSLVAWAFELRDGLVAGWRAFEDLEQAAAWLEEEEG